MPLIFSRHWFQRHWLLLILVSPIALFFAVWLYFWILSTFFQYEIGSDVGLGQRQLEKALAAKDPNLCKRIIVTQLMPGPAKYDLVNGCYAGYATQTGDISLCMGVISAGACVMRIAKDRNDPMLCEKAIDPRRPTVTDDRGLCFGYFAGREKDYVYCDKLKEAPNLPDGEINACRNLYYDATGDTSFYSKDIQEALKKIPQSLVE